MRAAAGVPGMSTAGDVAVGLVVAGGFPGAAGAGRCYHDVSPTHCQVARGLRLGCTCRGCISDARALMLQRLSGMLLLKHRFWG
jgi:hypothetical protein